MTAPTIHPVADLFPMLSDDDLDELAADIRERGLLQPIVVDTEGVVLDGRNRLAACQRAGVEPWFDTYQGDDPVGFVLSVNIARRNLSKGQAAMIVAAARFVSKQDMRSAAKHNGISASRVAYAVVVYEHAPELVDEIIAGARGLDEAYREARKRKEAADSAEVKLRELRDEYPDLADLVEEGRLTIGDAMKAAKTRRDEEERQRRVATELLCKHIISVAQMRGAGTATRYDPDMALPGRAVTPDAIDDARIAIEEIAQTWKERGL